VPASKRLPSAPARAFARAASVYWLDVSPRSARELRRWRASARAIPDPRLRALALSTQRRERGNTEGAAAFATLAGHGARESVVRSATAFQTAYDYLDTLAEQPCSDPRANGLRLHLALAHVFTPARPRADHYARCEWAQGRDDGGYLEDLVAAARAAFLALPSHAIVEAAARRCVQRMATYQALCHGGEHAGLRGWSTRVADPAAGLRWWEAAAAAASSLPVFALLAAAADPALDAETARRVERAYFPWIGALHVLLDSLVDRRSDRLNGHFSLVACYADPSDAATRMGTISDRALQAAATLSGRHALLLGAMASFYLSSAEAREPDARPSRERVLGSLEGLTAASMATHAARGLATTLRRRWEVVALGGGGALQADGPSRARPRRAGRGEPGQHQLEASAALRR
jgi:tetraprenyl-beta-curcumene synthase